MKISFTLPTRTLDYAPMGITAGIIAGLVLYFVFGITLQAPEAVPANLQLARQRLVDYVYEPEESQASRG